MNYREWLKNLHTVYPEYIMPGRTPPGFEQRVVVGVTEKLLATAVYSVATDGLDGWKWDDKVHEWVPDPSSWRIPALDSGGCQHEWMPYIGLNDRYDFCVKCQEKLYPSSA